MFEVKLYFSGNAGDEVNEYILRQPGPVYRLATFAYPKEAYEFLDLADRLQIPSVMIIDSGAFTAWSVGKQVQLHDLVAYYEGLIRQYGARHQFLFISLDAIPGERGRIATSDEINTAVQTSYSNYLTLHQHFPGYTVLPVFHSGEDFRLRDAYLNLTDYLCLSMDQGMSEHQRLEWAKRAAVPGFKYHGLAATGNNMVTQIPWTSVDSSSWLTVAAMGGVLWPTPDNRFRVMPVSVDSPLRHEAGKHYSTLSDIERQAVAKFFTDRGFDPEVLAVEYTARRKWNVLMWNTTPWRRNIQAPMDLFGGMV